MNFIGPEGFSIEKACRFIIDHSPLQTESSLNSSNQSTRLQAEDNENTPNKELLSISIQSNENQIEIEEKEV